MNFFGSVIFGAVAMGLGVGAIPLICGLINKKTGLAIGGFFACLAANVILGLFLSIPICVVFMILIFKKKNNSEAIPQNFSMVNEFQPNTNNPLANAEKLTEYKQLLDSEVITQEEYDKKKEEILHLEMK